MNWEQQKFEILTYYIGGKPRSPDHNKSVIRQLKDLGYLGSRTTSNLETMKTTPNGLVYLKVRGFDVDAPKIVDGKLVLTSKSSREATS